MENCSFTRGAAVLQNLFNKMSTLSSPAQWLVDWVRGPESTSGVPVTIDSALGYAPVWYAVSKISGHVSQLPLNLMRYLENGTEHAETHSTYWLMRTRPNPYQTAAVFKETLMLHALLTGNGRAAIIRRNGFPEELIPLPPHATWTCMSEGEKWHVVALDPDERSYSHFERQLRDSSSLDGKMIYRIKDEDVLHIPGLSYNGYSGLSLIQVARETFGLGLAAQRAGAKSFSNGGRPGIIIEAPPSMFRDDKDAKEFIDNFNSYHQGIDNAGRAALLREGMTMKELAISASDAQWVEQRRFERQEVALLFLLEQILGDDSSVSYNSMEQKNLVYLSNCLMRWLVKWEQECDEKLLNDRSRRNHFFKFNVAALLRADYKSTIESMSLAINARIINPNEAREKLDMNPYEGGDEYANPSITPGPSSGESQEDSSNSQPEDSNRQAIVARLRHLIGVSANNANKAANEPEKFRQWVNRHLDENGKWTRTFSNAVAEFGGSRKVAIEFCEECRQELLDVIGAVPSAGLEDSVASVVSGWADRASGLSVTIFEKGKTNEQKTDADLLPSN